MVAVFSWRVAMPRHCFTRVDAPLNGIAPPPGQRQAVSPQPLASVSVTAMTFASPPSPANSETQTSGLPPTLPAAPHGERLGSYSSLGEALGSSGGISRYPTERR
jgi:hypothetical protein